MGQWSLGNTLWGREGEGGWRGREGLGRENRKKQRERVGMRGKGYSKEGRGIKGEGREELEEFSFLLFWHCHSYIHP